MKKVFCVVYVIALLIISLPVLSEYNYPDNTLENPSYGWFAYKDLSSISIGEDQRTIIATGVCNDSGAKIFDIYGHLISEIPTETRNVWSAASNSGYVFIGSDDKIIEKWTISPLRKVSTYTGHKEFIWSMDIRDNIIASSGSHSNAIRLWNIGNNELIKVLGEEKLNKDFLPWVGPIKFFGEEIIAGYSDGIKIWNINRGTYDFLNGGHRYIYSIAISPDKEILATGSRDGSVCIWDLKRRSLIKTMNTPGGEVYSLSFISRNIIALGREYRIAQVYNWLTEDYLIQMRHGAKVVSVLYTSQGLVTASGYPEGMIRVWDTQSIIPITKPDVSLQFIWGKVKR